LSTSEFGAFRHGYFFYSVLSHTTTPKINYASVNAYLSENMIDIIDFIVLPRNLSSEDIFEKALRHEEGYQSGILLWKKPVVKKLAK
jgi:hypothetical protein